jgi:phage terminase large subunit GpA-like protein
MTMFIDVQKDLLFFVVAAWEPNFTGYIIDYGSFPDQHRLYFTLRDARIDLATVTKAVGLEGAIYAGLELLTKDYLGREWRREDGAAVRINRCLIDANWGESTEVVYLFCRQSAHASVVMPSHGRFVGASSIPFSDYRRKPGERTGHYWRIPTVQDRRTVRHVLFDANYWKSFLHARLAVPMGDRGCLSLFGDRPETHRLLADHLTSEYRVPTTGRGRTVDEWRLRPEHIDNHWLDCTVGAAVAASMEGVALFEATKPQRKKVSYSDLYKAARARDGQRWTT